MTTSTTVSPTAIQSVVGQYFAATRSLDLTAWLGTFAEDAISYEPGNPPLQGHDALGRFFQAIAGAFEHVGLQEEFVSIQGNQAAVKWIGHGKGKNGREVTFEGIDLFEIGNHGKIQTLRGYWDPAGMMAELQGS
jgi:steroid delta-isomerase